MRQPAGSPVEGQPGEQPMSGATDRFTTGTAAEPAKPAETPKRRGGRRTAITLSPPPPPSSAVLDAFAAARRHWPVVLGAAAIGLLLAWIFTALQPRRYRASALVAVAPATESLAPNEVLRGMEVLEQRSVIATIAALAMSPATMQEAGPDLPRTGYAIDAVVLPNTNLLRIDVEGTNAERVAAVANRIPSLLAARVRAMYKVYGVTTVSPAARPTAPFSPRVGRALLAGLLLGAILGAAAAYAIDRFRLATGRTS